MTSAPVLPGHRPGTFRRLGATRETAGPGDRGPRFTGVRATPIPTAAAIREDTGFPILDQGQLGSCVAQATAEAIYMRELAVGAPGAALGSRLWNYRGGRAVDGTVDKDAGTSFRSVFTALEQLGFPPETALPYDDTKTGDPDNGSPTDAFRREPSSDATRLAFDTRKAGSTVSWQSIDDLDGDLIENVIRALAADYPVGIAVDVDDDFTSGNFDPATLLQVPEKSVGGHALVIVGYDLVVLGGTRQRRFRVRNSWGADFANQGYVFFSEAYVRTGDLWIVERVPVQGGVS